MAHAERALDKKGVLSGASGVRSDGLDDQGSVKVGCWEADWADAPKRT